MFNWFAVHTFTSNPYYEIVHIRIVNLSSETLVLCLHLAVVLTVIIFDVYVEDYDAVGAVLFMVLIVIINVIVAVVVVVILLLLLLFCCFYCHYH